MALAGAATTTHLPLPPITAQPSHGTPVGPFTLPSAMHNPTPTLPSTTPHGHHPDISNGNLPGGAPSRRRSSCAVGPAIASSPDGAACRCWVRDVSGGVTGVAGGSGEWTRLTVATRPLSTLNLPWTHPVSQIGSRSVAGAMRGCDCTG